MNGWLEKAGASLAVLIAAGAFGFAWRTGNTVVVHDENIESNRAAIAELKTDVEKCYTVTQALRDHGKIDKQVDQGFADARASISRQWAKAGDWSDDKNRRISALAERVAHLEAHVECGK